MAQLNDFGEPMGVASLRITDNKDGTVRVEAIFSPELHKTKKDGKPFVTNAQKLLFRLKHMLNQEYGIVEKDSTVDLDGNSEGDG